MSWLGRSGRCWISQNRPTPHDSLFRRWKRQPWITHNTALVIEKKDLFFSWKNATFEQYGCKSRKTHNKSLKSNPIYHNVYFLGKKSTKNAAILLDFDQITTKYTTAGCGGCDLYELGSYHRRACYHNMALCCRKASYHKRDFYHGMIVHHLGKASYLRSWGSGILPRRASWEDFLN